MITGELKNGFKYKIADNALKDYTFVVGFSKLEKSPYDFALFDEVLVTLLGEKQRTKFVESFMDKDKKVPSDVLILGFRELLDDAKSKSAELKN